MEKTTKNSKEIKIGDVFEFWTVLSGPIPIKKYSNRAPLRYHLCKCRCGVERTIHDQQLRNKKSTSCGCRYAFLLSRIPLDTKINHFTIVSEPQLKSLYGRRGWFVQCSCVCGKIVEVRLCDLKANRKKSCGCRSVADRTAKNTKHGKSHTRLYRILGLMHYRCRENKKMSRFYGNKGIRVCQEWNDFLVFEAWALANGYEDTLSIDRIDARLDYCPQNCRWVTKSENASNVTNERDKRITKLECKVTEIERENLILKQRNNDSRFNSALQNHTEDLIFS